MQATALFRMCECEYFPREAFLVNLWVLRGETLNSPVHDVAPTQSCVVIDKYI